MKKIMMFAVAVLALVSFVACGGGSAGGGKAEAKKMLADSIVSIEKAAADIENAKDGKTALAAFTVYAEGMKAMAAKGQELQKKYGDLKDLDKDPSMAEDFKKITAASQKMMTALGSAAVKFKDDKEFMSAMQNFGKMMGE